MTGADSKVVLDSSVLVSVLAPDRSEEEPAVTALEKLIGRGTAFVGPRLLLHESRNALLNGIRRRRWDGADADRAARKLARFPIAIADDERDVNRAWELARRYDNHPIYDMVYIALAERLGARLLTQDERLLRRVADLDWVISPGEVGDD